MKQVNHTEECKQNHAKNDLAMSIVNMKEEAGTSANSMPAIYKNNLKPLYDKGIHLVTEVPSFRSVKCSLYSARKRKLQMDKTVFTKLSEVEIPAPFKNSLVADYQYEDSRLLVFCFDEAKQLLGEVKEYFCDGTFKSTPKPFHQLFIIYGDLGSSSGTTNVVPLVFALMSDKKESTYSALFDILQAKFPEWKPDKFHLDFEVATSNALKLIFPNLEIKNCYYHFTQSLWRKAKSIGIKTKLYRRLVGLCTALPLLPENQIKDGWAYIQLQCAHLKNNKINAFMAYMKNTWLKNDACIRDWCVSNERHRTNNVAESYNSVINKNINKNYVTINKLLNVLYNDIRVANFSPNERRQTETQKDDFILNTQMQLIHNQITVGHFLEILR